MTRQHFASHYRWLVATQILQLDLYGQRILDVGCDDAGFLLRSLATLKLGVDLQPRVVPTGELSVLQADARQLPIRSGTFDTILAFDILEHIVEDRRVMGELLRVLSPTGSLWFSTPTLRSAIWPSFVQPYANYAFGHVRNGYTAEQLHALLPQADDYQLTMFAWNEPALRATFVVTDLSQRIVPQAATGMAKLCFAIDRRFPQGDQGHWYGRITRRSPT